MSDSGTGWPNVGDVTAGMGDGGAGDPAPGAAPAAEPAATPAAPAPEPTPAATTEEDVFAKELEGDTFSRGYVEKLRNEGMRHRTSARDAQAGLERYESVFGRYEEADRELWLNMADRWAAGDERGVAEMMRNISSSVLDGDVTTPIGDQQAPATPAAGSPPAANGEQAPQSLTLEDVAAFIQQREAEQARVEAENRAVQSVHDEIRTGGFEPESPEGILAMWYASRSAAEGGTDYDVAAAVAKVKARDQAAIDRFVESKRAGGQQPTVSPPAGVVATSVETGQDFPKRGDVEAFLATRRNAQPGQ